ncbi:MAG: DUF4276 family protein [Planctomycetota bacterium]|nr:DUF4276 family protein [Planctomycetota bacterium]
MKYLWVAPIVEGHGEVDSVPLLLNRIGSELFTDVHIQSCRPIFQPRGRLINPNDSSLSNAIQFAISRLDAVPPDASRLVLLLVDADDDSPCRLGPQLLKRCRDVRPDRPIACVVANPEFETWFVAAAASLTALLTEIDDADIPIAPEMTRNKKKWTLDRSRTGNYAPAIDQRKFTSKMDLKLCRSRSPSFDKLCRELERAICVEGR